MSSLNPKLFLDICDTIAEKSECAVYKIGAVLVQGLTPVAFGYPIVTEGRCRPKGYCRVKGFYCNETEIPSRAIHAEMVALSAYIRAGNNPDGCIMFVNRKPCLCCSRLCYSVGIHDIYYREEGVIYCSQHPFKALI